MLSHLYSFNDQSLEFYLEIRVTILKFFPFDIYPGDVSRPGTYFQIFNEIQYHALIPLYFNLNVLIIQISDIPFEIIFPCFSVHEIAKSNSLNYSRDNYMSGNFIRAHFYLI